MNPARLLQGRSAHAIAFLALIFALGGSAYALQKNSVTSKTIKNGTIKDKDVKANGLTGASVAESTLGTVPDATSAANADTATNATNATNASTVDGQSMAKVQYKVAPVAPASTIFDGGGLRISASCASNAEATLTATTTKTNSAIYATISGDGTPPEDNPLEEDLENQDFDTGITFDMLGGGAANINLIHFVYQALDGTVVTGTLVADEFASDFCTVVGHVILG